MTNSLARSYARAVLPRSRKPRPDDGWTAPILKLPEVATDLPLLDRYRAVCGFPEDGLLPATYPHLTAFPASMALMTSRDFPLPVLGLVHVRNEIEQFEPLDEGVLLNYRVWIEAPYDHPKGTAFDVHAEAVTVGSGAVVLRGTSTYLRRVAGTKPTPRSPGHEIGVPPPSADAVQWQLPADLGRRYAAVSGDRNPIHLYPVTARAFGFKHPIAHGMWSLARCLSALATDYEAFRLTVNFLAPVPLPSAVLFDQHAVAGTDAGLTFTLTGVESERPHLVGRLVPFVDSMDGVGSMGGRRG